jgi:hypothetical protein
MRAFRGRLLLLLLLLVGLLVVARWRKSSPASDPSAGLTPEQLRQLAAELTALEAREQQAAETHWAPELVAQQCGAVFERLWDALNASTDRLAVLAAFEVGSVRLSQFAAPRRLPHGIEVFDPLPGEPADPGSSNWRSRLEALAAEGWRLAQCEFRHQRFEPHSSGRPARSDFWVSAHWVNDREVRRATLTGDVAVEWSAERDEDGLPRAERLDARRLRLMTRAGSPAFTRVLHDVVGPPPKSHFVDPLVLHDLDGDGAPEVVLASANLVLRWQGDRFVRDTLCRDGPGLIFTTMVADFDGDGRDDLLGARFEGLLLWRGDGTGRFGTAEPAWAAPARLRYGQVLTAADVDGDGDLDVWLGQYKNPYDGGQMPTPFYDANDGHPAYLLVNDGNGRFTDATEGAGLTAKRWRRTYSGSFADLDEDGDADLLVVNDFAGVDVYMNDGQGHFREVTGDWLPDPKVFGMSHAVADFDGDARLDLLVTGMHCPTALRLEALGLSRPERPDYAAMRGAMVRGNRLWRGAGAGRFVESAAQASIARSGWSWGCAAADFDNDGFPDVYITNGHETRQRTRDYDTEFWLHDIYVGDSRENPVVLAYFTSKLGRTRGHGMSYGGYEKNRLYLNLAGREFVEVGHLLGVAVEEDSRNLVVEDFDGDGRVDLIFTTFESWPRKQQTIQVWRNELAEVGNWVGLRLGSATVRALLGGRITLSAGGRSTPRLVLTGDSHRSQRSGGVHFGLGASTGPVTFRLQPVGDTPATVTEIPSGRYHHLPDR